MDQRNAKKPAPWRQADLAFKAGIGKRTLSSIESGKIAGPTGYGIEKLFCILQALSDPPSIDIILKTKIPAITDTQLELHKKLHTLLESHTIAAEQAEEFIDLSLGMAAAEIEKKKSSATD